MNIINNCNSLSDLSEIIEDVKVQGYYNGHCFIILSNEEVPLYDVVKKFKELVSLRKDDKEHLIPKLTARIESIQNEGKEKVNEKFSSAIKHLITPAEWLCSDYLDKKSEIQKINQKINSMGSWRLHFKTCSEEEKTKFFEDICDHIDELLEDKSPRFLEVVLMHLFYFSKVQLDDTRKEKLLRKIPEVLRLVVNENERENLEESFGKVLVEIFSDKSGFSYRKKIEIMDFISEEPYFANYVISALYENELCSIEDLKKLVFMWALKHPEIVDCVQRKKILNEADIKLLNQQVSLLLCLKNSKMIF